MLAVLLVSSYIEIQVGGANMTRQYLWNDILEGKNRPTIRENGK